MTTSGAGITAPKLVQESLAVCRAFLAIVIAFCIRRRVWWSPVGGFRISSVRQYHFPFLVPREKELKQSVCTVVVVSI